MRRTLLLWTACAALLLPFTCAAQWKSNSERKFKEVRIERALLVASGGVAEETPRPWA